MKVAVLLCGQPREAMHVAPIIKKLIIDPNKADVFMHLWYDDKDLYMDKGDKNRGTENAELGIDKQLIEYYKPKSYLVESDNLKTFKNFDNYYQLPEKYLENYMKMKGNINMTKEQAKNHVIKVLVSQVYSVFKCNNLKEEYAYTNNIQYDCVIKLRYDTFPKVELICSKFNTMNALYYENIGQPDNIISDWFNMGSNEIMNIYSSTFLNLKYLNNTSNNGFYKKNERKVVSVWDNSECCWSFEFLLRDLMTKYNIPTIPIRAGFQLMPKS